MSRGTYWARGAALVGAALWLTAALGGCADRGGAGGASRSAAGTGAGSETVNQVREHPFLFFTMTDVPRMKEAARSTHRKYYDHLATWGREFLAYEPLATDKLPTDRDVMQVYFENAAACTVNMGLLWHVSGDKQYLDAARKWLAALCAYPVEINGGYFVGSYALGLAAGYDMLYPWLDEAARAKARDHLAAVVDRGAKGTVSDWWAGLRVHHDHWLPAAGLCVGAAAVAAETPGGPGRLKFLSDHFDRAMKAVGQDGAWTEGAAQWTYAMAMSYIWFDVCKRVTGRDLFQTPMVRGHVAYRLYNWLPNDQYVFHHDSFPNGRYNVMGSASCHLLRKLAAELKSPQAQWLADRDEPRDLKSVTEGVRPKADWLVNRQSIVPALHAVAWNFLWYDPAVKAEGPQRLPRQYYFDNQGLVAARSGWGSGDAVLTFACAPRGGRQARAEVLAGDEKLTQNMGHIHAMAGSFNLFAGGNFLAVSPGYGGPSSRYENVLTIEDADQQLHPRYDARIRRLELTDDHVYVAAEATECYPAEAGLATWVRHLAWLTPDVLVIGDELVAKAPMARGRKTVWRMDFDPETNDVKVDGQAFRVAAKSGEGKPALAATFLQPQGMELKVEELRLPKATWSMCGQVQASATDIFKETTRTRIVAALEVLENGAARAGTAAAVEGPGVMGAVVNHGGRSLAAAFVTGDGNTPGPVTFTLATEQEPSCLVCGLPPEMPCTAEVRRQAKAGGPTTYTITLRPGGPAKTSPAGTLMVGRAGRSRE